MNGLEEALNGVLSDPEAMKTIARMAGSLFGGEGGGEPRPAGERSAAPSGPGDVLGNLAAGARSKQNDKGALVKALSPYLSPGRRARLERAVHLAGMIRLAGLAMNELGGKDDV